MGPEAPSKCRPPSESGPPSGARTLGVAPVSASCAARARGRGRCIIVSWYRRPYNNVSERAGWRGDGGNNEASWRKKATRPVYAARNSIKRRGCEARGADKAVGIPGDAVLRPAKPDEPAIGISYVYREATLIAAVVLA